MNSSLVVPLLLAGVSSAAVQTIGARGQLMCGDKPIDNTEIKLWATHTFPRADSNLATVKTDSLGRFNVSGTESSVFTLTPEVRLYHRCNNQGILSIPNVCQRKVTYQIPTSYITKSGTVQKWYEMGTMNMEAKQKGETGHCLDNPFRTLGKK